MSATTANQKNRLTYDVLRQEMRRQLVRATFVRGAGGPLLFIWSLGVAAFVALLSLPLYAVAWTVVVLLLGGMMVRDVAKSRKVQQAMIRSVVEDRFSVTGLSDPLNRESIQRGIELFTEIALKIVELERARKEQDVDLQRMLADADAMIALQYESAKQAEELERVLSLVDARQLDRNIRALARSESQGTTADAAKLREENIAAVRTEAANARAVVGDILQRLEVLMLQVFQLEQQAIDIVRAAEFARETEDALARLQIQVDSRRLAAQSVIADLMPERRAPLSRGEPGYR